MGNGYNQYQQNLNNNNNKIHKSTFMPTLCTRSSIKDVAVAGAVPRLEEDHHSADSLCNDPLSPKIGCMGQVKRNNKIRGFPTTSYSTNKLAITTNNNDVKYLKLKRLLSAKNNNENINSTSCCRRRRRREARTEKGVCINIDEMDPPLPVIKRVPRGDDEYKTLWKRRRSTGGALTSLELQHIQIPKHQLENPICLMR